MLQCGEVAERSKALRQGRNLFGGVGSNPTLVTLPKSQSAGLEPARAEPSGFLVHPLNRLGTTAVAEKENGH